MNKNLLFQFLISLLVSNGVFAQYCGGSGSSVCTISGGITAEGFYPPDDSFPCAIVGIPYDTILQVHTPATVSQGTSTYTLSHIVIDTISNLPCGICWATGDPNNQINGNSTGCVRFRGTTFDAPGLYTLHIIVAATVSVLGIPITENNQNLSTQGLHFELRVRLPNDTCVAVDTLDPGLAAHAVGNIAAPNITGVATICSGASTTLTASGTNYYGYVWSTGSNNPSIQVTTPGAYSVTVYGNCASASASVNVATSTVTQPTATANGPITFCSGGNVILNAGSGYSAYSWSNSSTSQTTTITQAGNYTCTVTENGCPAVSNTITVAVTSNPAPEVTAGGPVNFCSGDSVLLNAGSGYSAYLWSTNATTQSIEVAQSGTYKCTVTQNECQGGSNTITTTVNNPSSTVTSSGPLISCTGGIDTLDAGGGYSSYLWSTNASTRTIVVTQSGQYSCTVTQNGCQGVSNTLIISIGSGLNPTISSSPSLNICTGGSATLDPGPGYTTYVWSNGATSETINVNTSGTYTVTVTQGSCSGTATAVVNVGSFPLTVHITPAGPISVCAGTPVTLDAGEGFPSYNWSNSGLAETIQPTTSGNYTVTVTENFCTGTASTSVTFNALPVPAITPQGLVTACTGSNVTLDAGAGYQSYIWSNISTTETIQVSSTDKYLVTVTDNNGCSGTDSVQVNFGALTAPIITPAGNQIICGSQSVTLDAGSGYSTYNWSNGDTSELITTNISDTYNVTVTQNGCTGSSTVPVILTFNQLPSEYVAFYGSTVNSTVMQVSPTGIAYQWLSQQTPGGVYTVESSNAQSFTASCGTTPVYYTAVVNQEGCNDTSNTVPVICTGISDISSLVSFSIQPNPANDVLYVSYELNEATEVKISIIDITGRNLSDVANESESKGSRRHEIKLTEFAPGIYLLNFLTDKGSFSSKFIKQ